MAAPMKKVNGIRVDKNRHPLTRLRRTLTRSLRTLTRSLRILTRSLRIPFPAIFV